MDLHDDRIESMQNENIDQTYEYFHKYGVSIYLLLGNAAMINLDQHQENTKRNATVR